MAQEIRKEQLEQDVQNTLNSISGGLAYDAGDTGAGITFNRENGEMQYATVDQNTEIDVSNLSDGERLLLLLKATVGDLANVNYDGVSFDVSGQETSPFSITFTPDGTKLLVVGNSSDSIHQYSFTNANDINTYSYDGVSFDVSGQDGNPYDITFTPDGTKLLVVGGSNDSIYQYSFTNANNLNTYSFDGVSFDVSNQDNRPYGITFTPDGTKLLMVGDSNDSIYQYSFTNPNNLNTYSYDGVSFDVSGQEAGPISITFTPDGTKLLVVGFSSDSIHQYSFTNPNNLNTYSYDGVSFDVSGQDTSPYGVTFTPDGTKLLVLGGSSDTVYQYSAPLFGARLVYKTPVENLTAKKVIKGNTRVTIENFGGTIVAS